MTIELEVDDESVVMNEFVREILTSMITCAVSNLQKEKEKPSKKNKIGDDWERIDIEITKD